MFIPVCKVHGSFPRPSVMATAIHEVTGRRIRDDMYVREPITKTTRWKEVA